MIRPWIKKLRFIGKTPFHPQWLILREEKKTMNLIRKEAYGKVLDIGCGEKKPKKFLPPGAQYIGLDYCETAQNWYKTVPDVYGNANSLEFPNESFDCILLLDVLEHLPDPEKCLEEVNRILKPGGKLIILVPFLYPLHDVPLDFHRWSIFAFQKMAEKNNFSIKEKTPINSPLKTASLFVNLSCCKTVINFLQKKNPLLLLGIFLPAVVFLVNLMAWILSFLETKDDFMPTSYRMIWLKNARK